MSKEQSPILHVGWVQAALRPRRPTDSRLRLPGGSASLTLLDPPYKKYKVESWDARFFFHLHVALSMNKPESRESFETTQWSVIQAAVDSQASQCRDAMQQLCARYWFPLYAFARRRGYESDAAQDLIQGFFLRVLEKDVLAQADRDRGRFRNFLLASLKNYVANESAKASALRRGGERPLQSLDFRDAEGRLAHEAVDSLSPEAHFHRQWALQVLQRTVKKLSREFEEEGRSDLFDALHPYLAAGSERLPYAAVAEKLGMTSEAIKVAVHRMRRRYRKRLESEILDTVSSQAEVDEEIRELFHALSASNPAR